MIEQLPEQPERDIGPLARFELVAADSAAPQEVFRLLTDVDGPRSLREIAREWRVARGRFVEWFTTKHAALYDAALKVRAEELANEALERADAADPDTVGVCKLQSEVRLKVAARWDRDRYGDRPADTLGSLENLAEVLERISARKHQELRAVQNAAATDAEIIEHVPQIAAPQVSVPATAEGVLHLVSPAGAATSGASEHIGGEI